MATTFSETFVLNDIFNRIGQKLQLDTTRRQKAIQSYSAVSEFLKNSKSLFGRTDLEIYPQGSFAINTTNKPIARDEYDLDFVLELQLKINEHSNPLALLNELYSTFKNDGRYKEITTLKNRCVRLEYISDFHIDILPACPDPIKKGTNIKIPDRESKSWMDSNPKGFINWFEQKASARLILEKAAKIEPLPVDLPYEAKAPLKISVQLVKRHRDIYFQSSPENAPSSIVLTTLLAQCYQNELTAFDAITNFLVLVKQMIQGSSGPVAIKNPINNSEELNEDWKSNSALYMAFKNFIIAFSANWGKLRIESDKTKTHKMIQAMFGEQVALSVIAEQKDYLERYHKLAARSVAPTIITNPQKPWKKS